MPMSNASLTKGVEARSNISKQTDGHDVVAIYFSRSGMDVGYLL